MNKITTIREACVLANPEIVELKFGTILKLNTRYLTYLYSEPNRNIDAFNVADSRITRQDVERRHQLICLDTNQLVSAYSKDDENPIEYKIIGRPITLSDILFTIKDDHYSVQKYDHSLPELVEFVIHGKSFSKNYFGENENHIEKDYQLCEIKNTDVVWNLKEPLSSQSEECIEFIYNLLKQNE